MNQSKLFIFKNKPINWYSVAQWWYQQLFLRMQEKHCSPYKVRIFITKKTYGRWTIYFKNFQNCICGKYISKVYIETRFLQAVCSSEMCSKIVQPKLVLVRKYIFKLVCRWENCRWSKTCWTQENGWKIFEQIVTVVYLHVILFIIHLKHIAREAYLGLPQRYLMELFGEIFNDFQP